MQRWMVRNRVKIQQLLDLADKVDIRTDINVPPWNEQAHLVVKDLRKDAEEEGRTILQNVSFQVKGYKKSESSVCPAPVNPL